MKVIKFNCVHCGGKVATPVEGAGGELECPHCDQIIAAPDSGLHTGMEFAGFVIERRVGLGGMGEVWLARHKTMDRQVALKILSPELTNDAEFVHRFLKEARNAARIAHPNVVTAFDAGEFQGIHYLAMEWVDGVDLGAAMDANGKLPERKAMKWTRQIAEALQNVWDEHRMLHCDLKPANIMIDAKGTAKLMDLGLSKRISSDGSVTMNVGGVMGTPKYISPEQAKASRDVDPRADVYSLGATLYDLLTGKPPFDADTHMGIVAKHLSDPLPPPESVNPELSIPCRSLLKKMLAKNPDDRHQSWNEVIEDVDRVLEGLPLTEDKPALKKKSKSGKIKTGRAKTGRTKAARAVEHSNPTERLPFDSDEKSRKPLFIIVAAVFLVLGGIGALLVVKSVRDAKESALQAKAEAKREAERLKAEKNALDDYSKYKREEGRAQAKKALKVGVGTETLDEERGDRPELTPDRKRKSDRDVMWENAMAFTNKHPDKVDEALERFRVIKSAFPDSKHAEMADAEIKRLSNAWLNKNTASPEELDEEIRKREERLAKAAAKRKEMEKRRLEEKRIDAELQALAAKIAAEIMDGNLKDAWTLLDDAEDGERLTSRGKELDEIGNMITGLRDFDASVMAGFKPDVGKVVVVETKSGSKRVKITGVSKSKLSVEMKSGGIKVGRSLPRDALTLTEKLKRAKNVASEPLANLFTGIRLSERGEFDQAAELFGKTGILADAMIDQLSRVKRERWKTFAEEELFKLAKKHGLRLKSLDPSEVKEALMKRRLPRSTVKRVMEAVKTHHAEIELIDLLSKAGINVGAIDEKELKRAFSRSSVTESQLEALLVGLDDFREKWLDSEFFLKNQSLLIQLREMSKRAFSLQFDKPWTIFAMDMRFVPIKPGEFMMGGVGTETLDEERGDRPELTPNQRKRKVSLTKPFWMAVTEVTQAQYKYLMKTNPSVHRDDLSKPVERVSWNAAVAFCAKLTRNERNAKRLPEGYVYRLPTEAEWEYCCRAGTDSKFSFGGSMDDLHEYGNYCDASNTGKLRHRDKAHDDGSDKTAPVGSFKANPWGIHDLHGNVWEWCHDRYADADSSKEDGTLVDPIGPNVGSSRVNRGGAWDSEAARCASGNRGFDNPDCAYDNLGFRVVLAPEIKETKDKQLDIVINQ